MNENKFNKLSPMLLHEVNKPFNNNEYLYELKFDGVRTFIFINNDKIIIKSRRGLILNDVYPELLSIKNITSKTVIFDGEIVLMKDNKPSFLELQKRVRLKDNLKILKLSKKNPVTFVVFDILYENKDLTRLTLLDRKKILGKYKDTVNFVKSKCFNDGIKLFDLVKKEKMEGIVAKRRDSLYKYNERTRNWLKIKNYQEGKFWIVGYNLTKSKVLSLFLAELKKDQYYFVGKMVMGPKNKLYKRIIKEKSINNYLINCEQETNFIKPKYQILVNYIEKTSNGILRQPFIKY